MHSENRNAVFDLIEETAVTSDAFIELVSDVLEELRTKFDLVTDGRFEKTTTGWPKAWHIKKMPDRSAECQAWGALAAVESITEREILVTYDPARDQPSRWAMTLPPLGLNLSGCSGGPVLMHGMRNGLHRWFPVAIVIAGPKDGKQDLFTDIDLIRLRRIHIVQPDGSISRP